MFSTGLYRAAFQSAKRPPFINQHSCRKPAIVNNFERGQFVLSSRAAAALQQAALTKTP